MSLRRREFLASTAVGLVTTQVAAQPAPAPTIIDCHTHFYDPTRPQGVPWPGKNDDRLYRPFLPAEFKKLAAPLGVVGTVVVEASPWVEDNQWLLDLAERDSYLRGIVGNLDPMAEDFERNLHRFARNPKYRGLRIGHRSLTAGLDARLRRSCELLADLDLALDVNGGPDMPADVARLAKAVPQLRIVINHAANLPLDGQPPPQKWLDGMQAAAQQPRVYCKVSALVEQARPRPAPRAVDFYRPALDALWALFGDKRLIYGSNWPVSQVAAPLDTVVGIVRDYFQTKGDAAADNFFQHNARSAYAWPMP